MSTLKCQENVKEIKMSVGDLVVNKHDKEDGIGVIVACFPGPRNNAHYKVFWSQWSIACVMHEFLLEVISESR